MSDCTNYEITNDGMSGKENTYGKLIHKTTGNVHKGSPVNDVKYIGFLDNTGSTIYDKQFVFEKQTVNKRQIHIPPNGNFLFRVCTPAEGGARKRVKHTRKSHRKMKRSQTKRRSA